MTSLIAARAVALDVSLDTSVRRSGSTPTPCPVAHRPHDCRKPGACLTATLAALDNADRITHETAERFDRRRTR